MTSFALYRLPHEEVCTLVEQTEGQPQQLTSLDELGHHCGYVMAPFVISDDCPLLVIDAQHTRHVHQDELLQTPLLADADMLQQVGSMPETVRKDCERSDYGADFRRFHAQLTGGTFRKLVLARRATVATGTGLRPLQLFADACHRYPRLFVSLVFTPQSGLWLTATPEVLLEGSADSYSTIALAGTMRLQGDVSDLQCMEWTAKNREEQRIVADYIGTCLRQFSRDVEEQGPFTVRAANLVHLRSDFRFTLYNNARVGELLSELHPTPAVCGLPKHEARQFIVANEHAQRRYYSGFQGPMRTPLCPPEGGMIFSSPTTHHPSPTTHLFVSLRCMQLWHGSCWLFAGGGLLPESSEEQEWQETEAKMETMRRLL